MTSLKNEALAACRSALAELGFAKSKVAFLREQGDGVSGWLGLNLQAQGLPATLLVNPVIGVRFARLAELRAELQGELSLGSMPSISKPLGYVMPEKMFRQWEFAAEGDSKQVAVSLANAVREYGDPYIAMYSDWGFFSGEIFKEGQLTQHERPFVLPLVSAINGNREEAQRMVEGELARVGDSSDMYSRTFRSFADRFSEKFR